MGQSRCCQVVCTTAGVIPHIHGLKKWAIHAISNRDSAPFAIPAVSYLSGHTGEILSTLSPQRLIYTCSVKYRHHDPMVHKLHKNLWSFSLHGLQWMTNIIQLNVKPSTCLATLKRHNHCTACRYWQAHCQCCACTLHHTCLDLLEHLHSWHFIRTALGTICTWPTTMSPAMW